MCQARAVADMNQRDRQSQNEQEERHVSSSVDVLIVGYIWGFLFFLAACDLHAFAPFLYSYLMKS